MTRMFEIGKWGRGEALSVADGGGGAAANTGEDYFQGETAKEAVANLEGNFAEGKLPDLEAISFPGPIAEACYWDNSTVVGIVGPVGSGKTHTGVMMSRLRRAIEMPRSGIDLWARHRTDGSDWFQIDKSDALEYKAQGCDVSGMRHYTVLFIRENYRQLWSTTILSYFEVFPRDVGDISGGKGGPMTHTIEFEDDHGPIRFTAMFMAFGDNPEFSLRGVQVTDIVMNEMDTMPKVILAVGIGRRARAPKQEHFAHLPMRLRKYGQVIGDFNAPEEDNWVHGLFYDEAERKRVCDDLTKQLELDFPGQDIPPVKISFHHQPGYGEDGCENLHNLSPGYYVDQIGTNKMIGRGDMNERLVYNRVTAMRVGDPVFKREFNRRVHVSDAPLELIPDVPLRIGLDQGFKGAAVICQFVDPFHWRVYAELHHPKKHLMAKVFGGMLADLLDERFAGVRVEAAWGDMAGEHGASAAADENATWNRLVSLAAGITIRPQTMGTNRIQPRLEAVRAPLEYMNAGQPGLLIDPSCKLLIRGFEARYVWTDTIDKNGAKRKIPDKSFTEANVMDAFQYVALSELRADGVSKISFPGNQTSRLGHNGGPSMPGQPQRGLQTGYDILNPYPNGGY